MRPRIDKLETIEPGKMKATGAWWDGHCTCSDEPFEVTVNFNITPTKNEIKNKIWDENVRGIDNNIIEF